MKKSLALLLSILLISCIFAGCQNSDSTTVKENTTETTTQPQPTTMVYSSPVLLHEDASKTLGQGVNKFEEKDAVIVTYDGPDTLLTADEAAEGKEPQNKPLAKSNDVEINVNGHPLFVYETGVSADHAWHTDYKVPQLYTPVTYFDFEGKVTVEIDVSKATDVAKLKTVTVSPISRGVEAKIDGQKVSFDITENGDYTVVFNEDVTNAVHIFANEIDDFVPDENTIVIGPGEWTSERIYLESDQTLYLQGGAVLHSYVKASGKTGAKIKGRGIIDGSHYKCWREDGGDGAHVPVDFTNCNDFEIEGVTILNSNCWVLNSCNSTNGEIENVHIISGRSNGDGITLQSCQNLEIKDCFVRSWDDTLVVKNYTSQNSDNISFENMTLWTDLAQSMEIGYETNKACAADSEISNISFEDITVIYNFHKPVISIHNADDALVHDISYKNITVENANMGHGDGASNAELIEFSTSRSGNWSSTEERGNIRDVIIENVTALKTDRKKNVIRIRGFDENSTVENVTLKNITVAGKKLTEENRDDPDFYVKANDFVKNLIIK